MTRAEVAERLLDRAAAHDRYAEAVARWTSSRTMALRGLRHSLAADVLDLAASALGYRRAEPTGLELHAAQVLHGAAVTQCETGHEWPATVRACVEATVRGVKVPTWHDVCGDCALALLDAGLMYGGYGKGER